MIVVRPATEGELAMVRHSWRRSWRLTRECTHPNRDGGKDRVLPWAGGVVIRRTAMSYLARFIEATATTSTCLVAAVATDSGGEEPLAWVCRELLNERDSEDETCALHYVYTVQTARRRGLAKMLVQHVLREAAAYGVQVEPTHMNGRGGALMEAAKR